MKKAKMAIVFAGLATISALSQSRNTPSAARPTYQEVKSENTTVILQEQKIAPVCDGIKITYNCEFENIQYKTYIYHPAVSERSHSEQVTTYKKQVVGYCTLCKDDTYSPSCATGRGACSHHGGVAQYNAPRYSQVPAYQTKTVIDTPAQAAYYEKAQK